jgi:hypothetical protein
LSLPTEGAQNRIFLCLVLVWSDAALNLLSRFDRARSAVHGLRLSSLAG